MARKQGSGFKMKRGPMKDLGSFFSSFGKQLREGQKERGIFSEKGKAEKKKMRKTGESKFQYDVRMREARNKASRSAERQKSKSSMPDPKTEIKGLQGQEPLWAQSDPLGINKNPNDKD